MIKSTLLLLAARLIIPRLRVRSAAERHLLWAATLAWAACLPALEAIVPRWQPAWIGDVAMVDVLTRLTSLPRPIGDGVIVHATGLEPATRLPALPMMVWTTGTVVALLFLTAQFCTLFRIRARARVVTITRIRERADQLRTTLGLARAPELLHSDRIAIPMTWGMRRTRVLLPSSALGWPDDRIVAILAHELAHLRRADWPIHLLAEIVCALYWFNPLVWMARRQLRLEADRAADDVVLGFGIDGRDYAAHLVDIVRGSRAAATAATLAAGRSSDLRERIALLLGESRNRSRVTPRLVGAALGMSFAAGIPLAALAPTITTRVEVRTANLPSGLQTQLSGAPDASSTAAHHIRAAAATAASGVVLPQVLELSTPPLYSDEARSQRIEGVVVVEAHIDQQGRVVGARLVRGLGHGLDQNALVALRQWQFRPGTHDGVPAPMDVDLDIEFSLRLELLNELIANDMATQVGPGIAPPRVVFRLDPPRTPERGRVLLDVVLLEDGRPRIVRILRSASPRLDEVAVDTFERWRFSPARRSGLAVKVRMTAEVNFDG